MLRIGHVGVARGDSGFEHLLLGNQILGGQFTSRLNEKLREQRGLTYGVRSHFDGRLGRGPFSIATSVQSDRVAEALEDIRHELLALLGDCPPTEAELCDARRSLVEGQTRQFETPSAMVGRYAHLFVHGLPPDHYAGFADRLAAIDLQALRGVLEQRIHPEELVAVVVADAARRKHSLSGSTGPNWTSSRTPPHPTEREEIRTWWAFCWLSKSRST